MNLVYLFSGSECKQRSEKVAEISEICIDINASVVPVMMSLHLCYFDKQLFIDYSILSRHHTLQINK